MHDGIFGDLYSLESPKSDILDLTRENLNAKIGGVDVVTGIVADVGYTVTIGNNTYIIEPSNSTLFIDFLRATFTYRETDEENLEAIKTLADYENIFRELKPFFPIHRNLNNEVWRVNNNES